MSAIEQDQLQIEYDRASDRIVELHRDIKACQKERQRPRETGERSSDGAELNRRQKRFEAALEEAQEQLDAAKLAMEQRRAKEVLPQVEELYKEMRGILDEDAL